MPSLLLVRHGQASFGGEDYDVLSALGHEQAAVLADDLVRREVRVDRVVSGEMARQRDTAQPLAERLGLTAEVDARLDEYDADDILSAHSTEDVRLGTAGLSTVDFQAILEEALLEWVTAGAAGGAGETWHGFRDRVLAATTELAGTLGSGETAAVFTSGGVIGAICAVLLDAPEPTMVRFNRVTVNAATSTVAVGRGGMTLVSFNEHQHLHRRLVTYR